MKRAIYYSFLIITIMFGAKIYGNETSTVRESQIGGFDFNSELINESKLIEVYGKGCIDSDYRDHPDHYRRTYYFPDHNTYGVFNIETDSLVSGLEITKKAGGLNNCSADKSLNSYATGKGLTLGDNTEDIVKLYGQPTNKKKEDNITSFEYYFTYDEGPFMIIKSVNDKVVSIYITVGD